MVCFADIEYVMCFANHLTSLDTIVYIGVFCKSPHLTRYYIMVCFANHLTSILYRILYANHLTSLTYHPDYCCPRSPKLSLYLFGRNSMLLHHPQLQVLSDFAFFYTIDIDFICLSFREPIA